MDDHKPRLVDSLDEVKSNARAFRPFFEQGQSASPYVYGNFRKFTHWYYFPDMDVFAPTQFIGYKETTLSDYDGSGDGRRTQERLKAKQWFTAVERNSAQHGELFAKLDQRAPKGQHVRANAYFYVLNG